MRKCSFTIKHKRGNSSSLINYLCFLLKAFHVQSSRAWDGHISQGLNLLAQPMVRFGKWSAGRADFRCLALWGLFWQEETMIVQLLSQTAPRNHNQNSHLQGKGRGKGGKKTHFYFFTCTTTTNPAVIPTGEFLLVRPILSGSPFQSRLRATHLCPRADILITDPPLSSSGGGTCAEQRESNCGLLPNSRMWQERSDVQPPRNWVDPVVSRICLTRKSNHLCSEFYTPFPVSALKYEEKRRGTRFKLMLVKMMQFTSWMRAAGVLGRVKPFLHSADER